MIDKNGTTGTGAAQVYHGCESRMVIGLARVAQVAQPIFEK